ncbi:T9SS type A sorting domain-containing protein [Flavobacterium croceum]|uniref:T9SS type A sorting domain-containing protein n=1 Tax=Flavobacterium croceum TaxID=370975 RepID=UPI0024A95BD7|nr:T9SS type A sorting domain-containing protein [Flavobacterium croceum]
MKKAAIILLFLVINLSFSQSTSVTATRICDFSLVYPNSTGIGSNLEPGNSYGCLGAVPNPRWFYFKTTSSGNLTFDITQGSVAPYVNLDIDFVCYGPFDILPTTTGSLTSPFIIGCTTSESSENLTILNAPAQKYYLIVTTNFTNVAGFVKITALNDTQNYITCTDLGTNNVKNTIKFYPNPVENTLTIDSNDLLEQIKIFNVLGQEMMNINAENSNNIDVTFLPKGTYFLKSISKTGVITARFEKL